MAGPPSERDRTRDRDHAPRRPAPCGRAALRTGAAWRRTPGTLGRCPPNSSTAPTSSPGTTRRTARSSRTSRSRSTRAPRSASSGPTDRASPACCGSWPGWTTGSSARPGSRPGSRVGYLEQEPQLDPTKNVKQNVLSGVGEVAGLIEQYNAVMAKWSDPDADYEAVGAEQAALEDRINAADAWNLERNVDIAMDALRCPPDDAEVAHAVGRREAARGALPAAPQPPRPAAPRRAHQPPRRRVRRLARAVPPGVQRHGRRDHPRSLLPGQRRAVDPRAGPRPRHPVQRQLLGLAGAEARPHGDREQAGRRPAADARPRARLGADEPQGPPVEGQGPPVRVRAAAGRGERRADGDPRARDRDPARPAARRPGHRRRRACARATATGCWSRT